MSELFKDEIGSFIKWPGGKGSELEFIKKYAPKTEIRRFIEPFLGGGSVFLSINSNIERCVNDICPELIDLYSNSAVNDLDLYSSLSNTANMWKEINSLEDQFINFAQSVIVSDKKEIIILKDILQKTEELCTSFNFDPNFIIEFKKQIKNGFPKKINRIKKLQIKNKRNLPIDEFAKNIAGSYRSSFYMTLRKRYNTARSLNIFNYVRTSDFYFLREFSYASMFRFNSKNEFNVPYGGISYNNKNFHAKVNYLYSPTLRKKLVKTKFFKQDFEEFLNITKPKSNDFVFVDPPYDSDFSKYDGASFDLSDQRRLEDILVKLNSKIMIVIGDTPVIRKIYRDKIWKIVENKLNYKWTIKERNNRSAKHLTITNY